MGMMLHRADRHLVYPPGGKAELDRMDPLLEEERKKARRGGGRGGISSSSSRGSRGGAAMGQYQGHRVATGQEPRQGQAQSQETAGEEGARIEGWSIQLDSDELINKWREERKKRWPTDERVKKRLEESWGDEAKKEQRKIEGQQWKRQRQQQEEKQQQRGDREASGSDDSSSDSSSSSESESEEEEEEEKKNEMEDEESSGSDMDPVKDAVSSKAPPSVAAAPLQPQSQQQRPPQQRPRKRPRDAPRNPFEPRHLLRALLGSEIERHVDAVAQVVRFVVRNGFLRGVELREGQAAEQARRRPALVVDVGAKEEAEEEEQLDMGKPLFDGALATATASTETEDDKPARGLFRPRSPTLRGIDTLAMPPEPDALLLMDPLRAADPKPLAHRDLYRLACDSGLRALLSTSDRALLENARLKGESPPNDAGMVRALTTLDALPSVQHRTSALELILGVSAQSQRHAHQLGPTFVRRELEPSLSSGNSNKRNIGEVELFRLGLRVGPSEVERIKRFAARISHVVGGDGPRFDVEDGDDLDDFDGDEEQALQRRMEARMQAWSKEADWRDSMRKLGLDV